MTKEKPKPDWAWKLRYKRLWLILLLDGPFEKVLDIFFCSHSALA